MWIMERAQFIWVHRQMPTWPTFNPVQSRYCTIDPVRCRSEVVISAFRGHWIMWQREGAFGRVVCDHVTCDISDRYAFGSDHDKMIMLWWPIYGTMTNTAVGSNWHDFIGLWGFCSINVITARKNKEILCLLVIMIKWVLRWLWVFVLMTLSVYGFDLWD